MAIEVYAADLTLGPTRFVCQTWNAPQTEKRRNSNCSDLMCPSYPQPVIPGLTRNPETFATNNGPYHYHIWIPAFAGMTGCGETSQEDYHRDDRRGIQPFRVIISEQLRATCQIDRRASAVLPFRLCAGRPKCRRDTQNPPGYKSLDWSPKCA